MCLKHKKPIYLSLELFKIYDVVYDDKVAKLVLTVLTKKSCEHKVTIS